MPANSARMLSIPVVDKDTGPDVILTNTESGMSYS